MKYRPYRVVLTRKQVLRVEVEARTELEAGAKAVWLAQARDPLSWATRTLEAEGVELGGGEAPE